MPFVDPNFLKDQFGVEGKQVLLTFGLLSPNKGIETVLRALPEVIGQFPNLVYIVLGATHPNLVRDHGEAYRLSLERLALDLGIQRHVSFYNRFVELEELKDFLGVADLYVTPYLNPAQITSGTLAYAYGSGKAVISTPYWHAEELLAGGRGVLVPFGDSGAIARRSSPCCGTTSAATRCGRRPISRGAGWFGNARRASTWPSFARARRHPTSQPIRRLGVRTLEEKRLELPALRLDHLGRMSDSTGLFQHAIYSLPDFAHGYCADDNARALIAMVLLEELEPDLPELDRLAETYASFMQYAFDPEARRFRNFMGFDRRWLEEAGSEDSQGRAVWALGTCVGRSKRGDIQSWAAQLFERALPSLLDTTSPRTWASTLLGIYEYFRRLSGDRMAAQIRDTLTQRLIGIFEANATDDWCWFEDTVLLRQRPLSPGPPPPRGAVGREPPRPSRSA